MRNSLPPPTQALIWRRRVFAFAVLSLLSGCANRDFGEVRPILVREDIHDWVGSYASANPASDFELTDAERQLRDLGYPLIEAPYDRQQWYSVAGEYGVIRPNRTSFDRATYANRLLSTPDRSPSARYAQLSDDIRNDTTRMPQFFDTAARVIDIDQKRRKSLAYISDLSRAERNNAELRMRENASIIALVRAKLTQRVSSYRFALERLVIMTPASQAADVEHELNLLQAQIARYRRLGPPWVREQNRATVR